MLISFDSPNIVFAACLLTSTQSICSDLFSADLSKLSLSRVVLILSLLKLPEMADLLERVVDRSRLMSDLAYDLGVK